MRLVTIDFLEVESELNNEVEERSKVTRDRAWEEARGFTEFAQAIRLFHTKAIVTLNGGGMLVLATMVPHLKALPFLQTVAPIAVLLFAVGLGSALWSIWYLSSTVNAITKQRTTVVFGIDNQQPAEAISQALNHMDSGHSSSKWNKRLSWASAIAFGLGTLVLCFGLATEAVYAGACEISLSL